MEDVITISMEEYKELLIIKGKYEELKLNSFTIKTEPSYPYAPGTSPYGGPIVTYCSCNERK